MRREYRTDFYRRMQSEINRERRKLANVCINGPLVGSVGARHKIEHGPVVGDTGKCQRCIDVHARTATRAASSVTREQPSQKATQQ